MRMFVSQMAVIVIGFTVEYNRLLSSMIRTLVIMPNFPHVLEYHHELVRTKK